MCGKVKTLVLEMQLCISRFSDSVKLLNNAVFQEDSITDSKRGRRGGQANCFNPNDL